MAVMWGLCWVPTRALESVGLPGAWTPLAITSTALLGITALALLRRESGPLARGAVIGALLLGVAVASYFWAITLTDVVRAVLLFYFAPAWSTALECMFLGRRWNWRNGLALLLSAIGMVTIFRGVPMADWNGGDLLALLAGLVWAIGAMMVFTGANGSPVRLTLVTCLAAAATAGVGVLLGAASAAVPIPRTDTLLAALPLALAAGVIYLTPMLVLTLWSAILVPPAMMSFLLSAEIATGVGTSALFLGERFGIPELAGTVLIGLGAMTEMFTRPGLPRHRRGGPAASA